MQDPIKTDVAADSGRMIGARLRILFQALVERIDGELRRGGFGDVTPSHFVVFQHLPADGARLTWLAQQAQITKQSMAYLVQHLEAGGYVQRQPDPEDGRSIIIRWTDKGRQVERVARGAIAAGAHEWSEALGRDRFESFEESLRDIVALIESNRTAG